MECPYMVKGFSTCGKKAVFFYAVTRVSNQERWTVARCGSHRFGGVDVRIGDHLVSDISFEEFTVLEVMES